MQDRSTKDRIDLSLEARYLRLRDKRDELEVEVQNLRWALASIVEGEMSAIKAAQVVGMIHNTGIRPKREPQPRTVPNDRKPVVYYIEMSGMVKIGTTINFLGRMQTFCVRPDQVLAIEPGSHKEETARHKEFAYYRRKGTELFARNPYLNRLIESLRAEIPDPWDTAVRMTAYNKTLPAS